MRIAKFTTMNDKPFSFAVFINKDGTVKKAKQVKPKSGKKGWTKIPVY